MKRIFKMTLYILASLFVIAALFTVLFLNLAPQFGASKKNKLTERVLASNNHNGGLFHNIEETSVMLDFKWSTMKEFFRSEGKEPKATIPSKLLDTHKVFSSTDSTPRFTWFGHSALLLELSGKKIFIDPMLTDVPAPLPFLGPKRFDYTLPLELDSIPYLDAILISHDHYDHLDYKSIMALKDKTKVFIVPLGVDAHLRKWNIEPGKIIELDWWKSASIDDVTIVAAPARHFSGRSISDRNTTLWSSFVIQTKHANLYFSGDSGYGEHFKQIGDKYGPFDICFLECGQYNEQWAEIHMMPEEVVLANNDLQGNRIFPIHWSAFKLSLHGWTEPIDRLITSVAEKPDIVLTPQIGESVVISEPGNYHPWWKELQSR